MSEQGLFIRIRANSKEAIDAFKEINSESDALKNVQIDIDVSSIEDVQKVFQKLADSAKKATDASKSFSDSLKGLGSQLSNAANGYIDAVKGMFDKVKSYAAAGAASIGATLKSAFDVGGGFESSMTAVKIISGATAEQFDLLTAKARELGATLPITAQDAANAMTVMAQRGTSVKDILASVTDVTNLAISQNMSLADAADILGSAMTNFGIATTEASRVTDIFNNASNQSALTMQKLNEALKYVAPTARAAGMSLEQAMAAMEVLANSGFDGSMIGTGLAGVISKIAASTEILGVKTQDAQGNMRALADIFTELSARGVTLSEMTDVFGERAAKMALSLAKSASSLSDFEKGLKSVGSTQSAVTKQMDTWANTVGGMSSALESVRLTVFDQLKEGAKSTVNALSDMVRAFDSWLTKTDAANKTLSAFLQGFGVGLPSLESFKRALTSFKLDAFLQKIKSLGAAVRQVFETIKTFASVAIKAFNSVYAVLGDSASSIGSFMQSLLKVSYTIKIIDSAFGGLVVTVKSVLDLFKSGVGVITKFSGVLIDVGLSMTNLSNGATTLFAAFSKGGLVIGGITAALTALVAACVNAAAAEEELKKALRHEKEVKIDTDSIERSVKALDKLREKLSTGFEPVNLAFEGVLDDRIVKSAEKYIKNLQEQTFAKLTESVKLFNLELAKSEKSLAISESAFEKYRKNIEKYLGTHDLKIFDALPEQFKIALKVMEADTLEAKLAILNELKGMSKEAWQVLDAATEGVKVTLNTTPFEEFRDRVADQLGTIVDDLEGGINKTFAVLGDYELSITANVDDANSKINELAKTVSEKMGLSTTGARAAIENMLQVLASKGDKTAQLLANSWKKPAQEVNKLTSRFKDFVTYLNASPSQFLPALKQMLASVKAIDPVTGNLTEAFKNAYKAVKDFANMSLDKLKSQLSDVSDAIKKGLLDPKAAEPLKQQAKQETWVSLKAEVNWDALKGKELDQARAVMLSKFQDALADIDENAAKKITERIKELTKGGWDARALTSQIFEELDAEISKTFKSQTVQTKVQQELKLPDFSKGINNFTQQTQQSTGQIASVGASLVSAMSSLQKSLEANTNAKSNASTSTSAGTVNLDTSRLENICSTIVTTVSEIATDVKGNGSSLAAIQNAIANIKGDTSYNYDVTINQTGFTVQSKQDATSLANRIADSFRRSIGGAANA